MTLHAPQPVVAVFVPGLMGAGILLSTGILIADGLRRLLPNRGARRKVLVAESVHNVVEAAARAAGVPVPEHRLVRRRPRSAGTYLAAGTLLAATGILPVNLGLSAYHDRTGTLSHNPWAIALGASAAVALFSGSLLLLVLAAVARRPPRGIARMLDSTPLGRLTPPPEDPLERTLALNPWLKEGEDP